MQLNKYSAAQMQHHTHMYKSIASVNKKEHGSHFISMYSSYFL